MSERRINVLYGVLVVGGLVALVVVLPLIILMGGLGEPNERSETEVDQDRAYEAYSKNGLKFADIYIPAEDFSRFRITQPQIMGNNLQFYLSTFAPLTINVIDGTPNTSSPRINYVGDVECSEPKVIGSHPDCPGYDVYENTGSPFKRALNLWRPDVPLFGNRHFKAQCMPEVGSCYVGGRSGALEFQFVYPAEKICSLRDLSALRKLLEKWQVRD